MIGTTIGNYRITAELGQGGMGVVYEAEDLRLNRTVALKFLPPGRMSESQRQRFLNEARAAARIHHPNICPIYAIEEIDGKMFMAMARLDGETISQRMDRQGMLPVQEAIDIAAQVARGLAAAHRMGIVHRDIKSSNIIISGQGNVSILDFGLALGAGMERVTRDGGQVGTPAYMSPEQALGEEIDERTDIWSLGVVLHEMLTGRLAFEGSQAVAVVNSILTREPQPVGKLRPEAAGALEAVVSRALAKKREDRWPSAAEMERELRRLGANSRTASGLDPALVETQLVSETRTIGASRRNRVRFAAAGVLLAAVIGGVAYWRWQRPALPEQKQVAVLPLSVSGNDPEVRAIADGLVEAVTAQLTELEQFRHKLMVVPASEVRARKIASAADARRVYGANLVVSGSAQRWGDRIQFNFTLIDASKLRQLAARSMEYDTRDAASAPSRAVKAVGDLLEVELNDTERGLARDGSRSTGAGYSDYLKGRGYLARFDITGNLDKALASLQSAVKTDPRSAAAHAALAEAYWRKATITSDKHWADRAQETAERAVSLDGNLAAAHVRLGVIYAERGRREEAVKELNRALELSPGSPEALRGLGDVYVRMGQVKEAEAAYVESTKRRPTDWLGHLTLGVFYEQHARYKEAEAAIKEAERLAPDNLIVHRILAATYLKQGRYAESRKQSEISLKLEPTALTYSAIGVAFYYEGRMAEGASALEAALDIDSSRYTLWGNLGTVYRHMPTSAAKIKPAFERAIELGEKQLRMTPEDGNVLSNLAEYWAKLGDNRKALDYLERIPKENRARYAGRFVLVYELIGRRKEAIDAARGLGQNLGLVNSIKDDPDLTSLWRDPRLHEALAGKG